MYTAEAPALTSPHPHVTDTPQVDATPRDTLHIGDQFSITGNDLLARRACGTLWVEQQVC